MQKKLTLHFHGYQPGDVVGRIPGPVDKPMEFQNRNSPVGLMVDKELVSGNNWTDAVLSAYGKINEVFRSFPKKICSADIEPFTLHLLNQKDPKTFSDLIELFQTDKLDLVQTCLYHPIVPHLEQTEQEVVLNASLRFYKPLDTTPMRGFWFPESVYNAPTAQYLAERSAAKDIYLILDSRQYIKPIYRWAHWSLNFIPLETKKVWVFGRDLWLSDAFAFGDVPVHQIVDQLVDGYIDKEKERREIPYTITMASDLESLLANPTQVDRLKALVTILGELGIDPVTHNDFIKNKIDGTYPKFEGEGEEEGFEAHIKNYSSWSDYFEFANPHTSDTRWTGLRRSDGNVVARHHKGKNVSQIWKHGFWQTSLAVNRFVSKSVLKELWALTGSQREQRIDFLSDYIYVMFDCLFEPICEDHITLESSATRTLEKVDDLEQIGLLARSYHEMLMGNRSCPRFWENIDTRVTFQNVVMLTHSLCDLVNYHQERGDSEMARKSFKVINDRLINFSNAYFVFNLGELTGAEGWETTENAWARSIQSEIPDISIYDVVKRAALYTVTKDLDEELWEGLAFSPEQVRADTGHIGGEMHGKWENIDFCEHHL